MYYSVNLLKLVEDSYKLVKQLLHFIFEEQDLQDILDLPDTQLP